MSSPEAPLLRRLNVLKGQVDKSLLTSAQNEAREAIITHRNDDASFINLHGPRYGGKTFLCWVLEEELEWVYHQALPRGVNASSVIYDHGKPGRRSTRRLRNHASINNLRTVVYVTERPAEEIYPRVELRPGDEHYGRVSETWEELGLDTETGPPPIQQ